MDLDLVSNPTADFIAKGKKQYESACGSCHGNDGKGDGVAAVALDPKPRNFHSADGWTNGRTLFDIYKSVNDGVPDGFAIVTLDHTGSGNRTRVNHGIHLLALVLLDSDNGIEYLTGCINTHVAGNSFCARFLDDTRHGEDFRN